MGQKQRTVIATILMDLGTTGEITVSCSHTLHA